MKREAVIAGLASEGLALILGSAEAGSSAVVGPMPTHPVEFRKCARDLKALSAAKEHTTEERGGGRDPGVKRPGAGRGHVASTLEDLSCRNAHQILRALQVGSERAEGKGEFVFQYFVFVFLCPYWLSKVVSGTRWWCVQLSLGASRIVGLQIWVD